MDQDKRVCTDCAIEAPSTESAYTLISSRFGWRLQYEANAKGEREPKWRCGDCWRKHKAASASGTRAKP
jgi:hypothetical protein